VLLQNRKKQIDDVIDNLGELKKTGAQENIQRRKMEHVRPTKRESSSDVAIFDRQRSTPDAANPAWRSANPSEPPHQKGG
jgi:hypothetical protein